MKLELNEIKIDTLSETESDNPKYSNFKDFKDILDCFERQDNYFKSLEKELTMSDQKQICYLFFMFLPLLINFGIFPLITTILGSWSVFKLFKHLKLSFKLSSFLFGVFGIFASENKYMIKKIEIYESEKEKFLNDFFIIPLNKEIVLKFLHEFYNDNDYRLSENVFSEINTIKTAIEDEKFNLAYEKIIQFKKRISYVNELNKN